MTGKTRLYTLFRDELERHTAVLLTRLPELPAAFPDGRRPSPAAAELAEALRHVMSSILGAARVVGAAEAESLTTDLESVVASIESSRLAPLDDVLDALRESATFLRSLGAATREESEAFLAAHRSDLQALSARLRALVAKKKDGEMQASSRKSEIAQSTRELFRIESDVHTGTLSDGLLVLERESAQPEVIERLMRAAHSLKGAARVVGLPAGVRLAHVIEEHLLKAQKNDSGLGAEAVELLLRGSDALKALARALDDVPEVRTAREEDALSLAARIEALTGEALTGEAISGVHEVPREPSSAARPVPAPSAPGRPAVDSRTPTGESERVLRVRASHLSKLVSLAGESLVEARRLQPFADAQHRLRMRQASLADLVNDLHQALGAPGGDDPIGARVSELRARVADCRALVLTWVGEFEEHARRSEDLTIRLYREASESRMRPLSDGLAGFPRMVRDVGKQLGKTVDLVMTGTELGIDRDILDKLEAPLNHLLRNAVDHGLEPPVERRAAGKPERGTVRIDARPRSGMLGVTVSDDGRGLDASRVREKAARMGLVSAAEAEALLESRLFDLIFSPGFSTRETATDISGRGVGLDVVQSVVHEVGGSVHVTGEPGKGTAFHLLLPLSRSVIRALTVMIAGEPYAFPLTRIDRLLSVPLSEVVAEQVVTVDGASVPLVSAAQVLDLSGAPPPSDPLRIVIVSDRSHRLGFVVDRFLDELDLVVRPLSPRLGRVADIGGAAILPDGTPALILDVEDMIRSVLRLTQVLALDRIVASTVPPPRSTKRVLVVDDSLTVRDLARQLLVEGGYEVEVAADGVDAFRTVRDSPFDLVITDIDMPRMDGLALTRSIKQDPRLRTIPVVIVSYRDTEDDRRRGEEAAADLYLPKADFETEALLAAVRGLIGGSPA